MIAACRDLKARHEIVGDVRGQGLMTCLELVSDRTTKTPAAKETVNAVFETTYQAGVMIRVSGHNVILSPPLIVSAADVTRIVSALDAGLAAAKPA